MIVFTSINKIDIESDLFKTYDNLLRHDQIPGMLKSIGSTHFKEIMHSKTGELKPLLWVQFNLDESVQISLVNKVVCRYVYVKLINCEDKRTEIGWEHPDMNIDMSTVLLEGSIFKL